MWIAPLLRSSVPVHSQRMADVRRLRRNVLAGGLLAALALFAGCGLDRTTLRPLTYDTIYGPERVDFTGKSLGTLTWLPDDDAYVQRIDGVLQRVDALDGSCTPLYDEDLFRASLAEFEAFTADDAARCARYPTAFSDDYARALIVHHNCIYSYNLTTQTLTRLTTEPCDADTIRMSADGARLAFTRDHDLYIANVATGDVQRITTDGTETLRNGVLDWVYQEEVFGRGTWAAHWWAADASHLAFLQLDDADVPTYPMVDYLDVHPTVDPTRYPKSGDPNPRVRLATVDASTGNVQWIDLDRYADVDRLIVAVCWTPDGQLMFCVQDREARWLELNEADPATGESHLVLRETTPTWTSYFGPPTWLSDGTFLWRSGRDGWPHLYRYARNGELLGQITQGPWEVRTVHGLNLDQDAVFVTGTFDGPLEEHLYRVSLAGGTPLRLTTAGYSHAVNLNSSCTLFIDNFSNVQTPTRTALFDTAGNELRLLNANRIPALATLQLSTPEFYRVPTPYGHALNAMLLRPPHMNPNKSYPVMTFTYAGPHGPSVSNRWGGREYLFKQLLAQEGYLVWTCDPYSASGEGEVSAWHCYERLGVTELEDLEASILWLGRQMSIDRGRIGIFGHSYGGFMASFALTHGSIFNFGIAAAPVTDWRLYDSVYTEKFMRSPDNNAYGYDRSSVIRAAGNLHGHLLVAYGVQDENVHMQNTLQLLHAVQQAGKMMDVMIYPNCRHGLRRNADNWPRLRYQYIKEHL